MDIPHITLIWEPYKNTCDVTGFFVQFPKSNLIRSVIGAEQPETFVIYHIDGTGELIEHPCQPDEAEAKAYVQDWINKQLAALYIQEQS